VNVRRKRHGNTGGQIADNFGGFRIGHGKPEEAAAHIPQAADTGAQGLSSLALKIAEGKPILPHGLNDRRMIAPDINGINPFKSTDFDYPRFTRHIQ
jgi:hypothetical protein